MLLKPRREDKKLLRQQLERLKRHCYLRVWQMLKHKSRDLLMLKLSRLKLKLCRLKGNLTFTL